MNKHNLTYLSFATLLCMMLFGTTSCKKDDTPDANKADFFIDAYFLPESEANGEVAPRLVMNFNDEAAMIELRGPSGNTDAMESVLLLCPDHEAMMLCGNDSVIVCASYDMETNTPSHDVLIVYPIDDKTLLLTKGFMNWNTGTLTMGDMMILPVDDNLKKRGNGNDVDGETRFFFFNGFIKRVGDNFDQFANCIGIFSPFGTVFSYIGASLTTSLTTILYADDPEGLYDATEYSVTNWTGSVVQDGILNLFQEKYSVVASKVLTIIGWHSDGGHGKVNDYVGEENDGFSYTTFWGQSSNAAESAGRIGIHPPAYKVNLDVSNVSENSVYLKGRFQYTSSITPNEMGYIIKVDGGPEHTEYDMNFQGITLSGLQKATKYTANAYVKNMGQRILSPGITFWTLGFEAFPTSLSFPKEGDTKNVALSYSEQDITHWEVTSKPSWCAVTKDNLGLLAVKVGRTSEARSGTITITAYSNALGSITQDITVTQFGENSWSWDGTFWTFVGVITTNGPEGYSSSDEMTFTLGVNSVSANNIEFSFAQALSYAANGYSDNYILDGNGNLKYTANANGTDTHANCQVTFIRTGATSATANFSYHESGGGLTLTASGTLQGTLLNAKEVKGNESIINFNSPIFNDKVLKNSGELR